MGQLSLVYCLSLMACIRLGQFWVPLGCLQTLSHEAGTDLCHAGLWVMGQLSLVDCLALSTCIYLGACLTRLKLTCVMQDSGSWDSSASWTA